MKRFFRWASASQPEKQRKQDDTNVAIGVLLIRVAIADKVYVARETDQIDLALSEIRDLRLNDIRSFRHHCEMLEPHMPGSLELACMLRNRLSEGQKRDLLRLMWRIAFADQTEHVEEDRLMALTNELLGVEERVCEHIRITEMARSLPQDQALSA